jgi:hypothetical protein
MYQKSKHVQNKIINFRLNKSPKDELDISEQPGKFEFIIYS